MFPAGTATVALACHWKSAQALEGRQAPMFPAWTAMARLDPTTTVPTGCAAALVPAWVAMGA